MLTAGVLLVVCALAGAGAAQLKSGGSHFNPADYNLEVPELIARNGYPVEVHEVVTSDGYILQMHRIPGGKNSLNNENVKRPAILVMHGVLSSSADFITPGPDNGLGYILADAGYDTWLGNNRGNHYSKRHASMSSNSASYWDFSWHEIGNHDLPAMIDYIIDNTGEPAIHYAGHSQGTTAFYVLNSLRPEYNYKVKTGHMMAPVASLENMEGDILREIAPLANLILTTVRLTGISEEIMAKGTALKADADGNMVCDEEDGISNLLCNMLFETMIDRNQFTNETLNRQLQHMPAGCALKQFLHYAQSIDSGLFCLWSFGALQNLFVYGSRNPPCYSLNNINAINLFHYYSKADPMTNEKDIDKLKVSLPSATFYQVPDDNFSHFDFAWGTTAKTHVYDKIVDYMKSYDHQLSQQA